LAGRLDRVLELHVGRVRGCPRASWAESGSARRLFRGGGRRRGTVHVAEAAARSDHVADPLLEHADLREAAVVFARPDASPVGMHLERSEEHTSELQSRENLVCRLLLEKKKQKYHA